MATDPSDYDEAIPIVAAHLAKIERAVGRTRSSHAGRAYAVVRPALRQALEDEDAPRVVPQVIDEFARRISEDPDNLPF
ncbi:hypothetical protein [Streptomyces hyaluromycini]|uniref:hypothetical protein n=1 Tax=Streptomyces hyaluromycini TaxID=1377993 RepID=UPI000B5CC46D|nr:hypothetical protein [Streptomyces hyaluromycini]